MIKCGKLEIDCFALLILGFIILLIALTICSSNETIEEEKTKQLEIEYKIKEKEIINNGTSN